MAKNKNKQSFNPLSIGGDTDVNDVKSGEEISEELQKEIDDRTQELGRINSEIEKANKELADANGKVTDAEKKLQELNASMQAKEKDLNARILQIASEEAELIVREGNAEAGFTQQLAKANEAAKKVNDQLAKDKAAIEKEISDLNAQKTKRYAEIDGEISKYRAAEYKKANDEADSIRKAAEKLGEQIKSDADKAAEKKERDAEAIAKQIEDSAEQNKDAIIEAAKKRAVEIERSAQERAKLLTEAAEEEKKAAEAAKERYHSVIKQYSEAKSKYDVEKESYERKQQYLKDREARINEEIDRRVAEECVNIKNDLEAKRNTLNELVAENKDLQNEKAELQRKLVAAKSQSDGAKDIEIATFNDKVKELEKQLKECKKKISEYGCEPEDVEQYKRDSVGLENYKKEYQELKKKYDKLNDNLIKEHDKSAENEMLTNKLKRVEDANRELSDELDKKKIVPRDVRIAPIQNELECINKNKNDAFNLTEKQWLDNIADQTAASGLVFSRRLLNAYHTSLKIGEWSPLVVLAGVSGTGKSELPRQYAHHGGMNFISVPVKPDWDSPQSLFGYYNAIESKFEPTELLRALYQMQDKKLVKDKNFKFDKGDQMCLVLLDEMNLAHVELYFADLLSKFESKRGTNDCAQYEISLGAGVGNEMLNIGSNILWTGTMNEDETTKALSDKVVDRSTLLTFPRPKKLIGRQKAQILEPTGVLTKKTWLKWVAGGVDLEKDHKQLMDELCGIVEQINDKMSEFGRNLGHRVWQGIQNYISNHPDVIDAANGKVKGETKVEDAVRAAFAEAVAFKIMPKLRGVETSGEYEEYIDDIAKIIDTHLPVLKRDFEKARSLPTRVFQWCSAEFLDDNPAQN